MRGRYSTQRRRGAALVAALSAMGALLPHAHSADGAWLDIEGRIQYAFYTEDLRALTRLGEMLAAGEDGDGLRGYYNGLAHYRQALIGMTRGTPRHTSAGSRSNPEGAAEYCVASLDGVLAKRSESVEALALQAACFSALGKLKPLRAPLAESRSKALIAKALRAAPRNPRVLLIYALEGAKPEAARGKEPLPAEVWLKRAIVAFETERQGLDQAPGWGAAEAYAHLGRHYLDGGDVVAARDALERALLIAPEFALARRLLARITSD